MKKIVISGCSYSYGSIAYGNVLRSKYGLDTKLISWAGQSNDSIINKIYHYITNNNTTNTLFICQLTWLHRIGWYNNIAKKWVDYQPNFVNLVPEYDEKTDTINFEHDLNYNYLNYNRDELGISVQTYDEMREMYRLFLKHHYNDKETFKNLLYKVDTIKAFVESKDNQIKFIWWPTINDDFVLNSLKERNVFNIDGEYSMTKWSTKKRILDGSAHLSQKGHELFADLLYMDIKDIL